MFRKCQPHYKKEAVATGLECLGLGPGDESRVNLKDEKRFLYLHRLVFSSPRQGYDFHALLHVTHGARPQLFLYYLDTFCIMVLDIPGLSIGRRLARSNNQLRQRLSFGFLDFISRVPERLSCNIFSIRLFSFRDFVSDCFKLLDVQLLPPLQVVYCY